MSVWRRHRYPQALVALVSSTVWLEASQPARILLLLAEGHRAHLYSAALVRKGRELARMYGAQRVRGLPVPGWFRG